MTFSPINSEKKTAQRFKKKLALHLPQACSQATIKVGRCPQTKKPTLAEIVTIPETDLNHLFDSETMLAISHAIEDLASETGQGELISTFQSFANFEPQRKRYQAMARDLDAVRVWGFGPLPKNCSGIDFIVTEDPRLMKYWLVLFAGPKEHAVLFCKQINNTTIYTNKRFIGFYSFNPYLVQSIRWRFNLLSGGLKKVVSHWEKSFSMPDLKMRDLDQYLRARNGTVSSH